MTPIQQERAEKSAIVLANASELAATIFLSVAGNDIADSLNGSRITMNTVRTLAQSRFQRNFDAKK